MAYRFLFIMDPIDRILPDKDTTFVLMLASLAHRHEVYTCALLDLSAEGATPRGFCRRTQVQRGEPHYRRLE
jgi:glutathione synthase